MTQKTSISLEDWFNTGSYFKFKEHDIFYQDTDTEKDVIFFIHGFPTASWDWVKLWHQLSNRYRLVAIDLLGYGFSAKPKKYPYSVAEQADLIESIMKYRSINSAHIVAHDYGDTVTQELLARTIERGNSRTIELKSITLLNGGIFPEVHKPRFIQTLLKSRLGPLISRLQTKGKFTKTMASIFGANSQLTQEEVDGLWQLMNYNNGKAVFHLLIQYLDEREKYRARWVGALKTSHVPIQFINGLDDPISGEHMVNRYQELMPNPKTVRLSKIGHYPQIEAPEAVLNAIVEFISPSLSS